MCTLETERLLLRPVCQDDLDDLFALRSDPQVLQFLGQGKPWTREETAEKLRRLARHWDEHGFGTWAMLDRADGRFVGWCGIGYWHDPPDIELGYTVAPRCWGRGLATEAVGCVLRYAFEVPRLPRVVGVARVGNVASQKVMLKAGMSLRQPYAFDVHEGLLYAVENPHATPTDSGVG
jgi:ribosomal-protein-alanine N-acetyltransferase